MCCITLTFFFALGVRFAGLTHPGLIGCAPSHELLAHWNSREAALIATHPHRVPPLACPPAEHGNYDYYKTDKYNINKYI